MRSSYLWNYLLPGKTGMKVYRKVIREWLARGQSAISTALCGKP